MKPKNQLFSFASGSMAVLGLAAVTTLAPSAMAQDALSSLEEIVVTAQFVEQSVQDTPIAITALSGDLLEIRGQTDTTAIGAQAPNVQLQPAPAFLGNALIAFIRGVGQQDFSPALEPGIGMYIDDVYLSTVTGTQIDLLDLDRIEILRGPQGTLTGKNSIGGAIKLFSKRPDEETDGNIEVTFGDYDLLRIKGGGNFTLIEDKLYGRISGVSHSRDGYVDIYDFGCLYPGSPFPNGRVSTGCKTGTTGGIDTQAARVQFRWLGSDRFEANLSLEFIDDHSESVAEVLTDVGPTTAPVIDSRYAPVNLPFGPGGALVPVPLAWPTGPFSPSLDPCVFITDGSNPNACPAQVAALGGAFLDKEYAVFSTFDDVEDGLSSDNESVLESQGLTFSFDYDISDTLQLQSISSYREYDSRFGFDSDLSPAPVAVVPQRVEHEAITQEFRLNGNLGSSLNWTVGAFYSDAETTWTGRINLSYVDLDFIHGPDITESETVALFANVLYDITDRIQVAAGVRWSDDEKSYDFLRRNPDLSEPPACIGPPGTPGNPPNCPIAGLNAALPQVYAEDRVDYRLALTFSLTDDVSVYGSVSSGYKAGGANARPFFLYQALPHEPEEVQSFEIGAKTELADNTLRLNGAVFFNDYTDVILGLADCTAFSPEVAPGVFLPGAPCFLPANAGEAEVQGFELEFDWAPNEMVYIDGSYSYIDFEYTKINPATGLDVDTLVQPFTPETTWSLGAQLNFDVLNGRLSPRIDVVYQDDMVTTPGGAGTPVIDDRTLVNGVLRWTSAEEDWVLALEGKNLTDEYYFVNRSDVATTGNGSASANPGMPRTFQVSIRRNF